MPKPLLKEDWIWLLCLPTIARMSRFATMTRPRLPLTTAAIPISLACSAAIEMLVHRIEHLSSDPPNRIALPIRLLVGATA